MKSESEMQDGGAVASKDVLGIYCVAVVLYWTEPAKHWWGDPKGMWALSQYMITAPNETVAVALAAAKAIKYRNEKTPTAEELGVRDTIWNRIQDA